MELEKESKIGIDKHSGANAAVVKGYYGVPILQRSLLWDGNGEDDNYGVGFTGFRFVNDGIMIGMGLNAGVWMENNHDVYAGEFETLLRCYPGIDSHVFFDLGGGWVQGTDPVPSGGTDWNMSFQFGTGVEVPVTEGGSVLIGATYHHISNALGHENARNPSQNDMRFWVGYAFTF
jgi:opacity protein-like surface antigen